MVRAPLVPESRAMIPELLCSPERDAIIKRDYPAGVDTYIIAERINALPGPRVSNKYISRRAGDLHVRRTPDYRPHNPGPRRYQTNGRWTPERDAIIKRDYPLGIESEIIAQRCNSLPAATPVDAQIIPHRAKDLGLARPLGYATRLTEEWRRKGLIARGKATAPKPPVVQIPLNIRGKPGVAQPPVPAKWETIWDQAYRDGYYLASMADLPSYNRRRIERGFAPLVRSDYVAPLSPARYK